MQLHHESAPRDRTRRPMAKRFAMTRRAQRRDKSARLFLAFAFPAEPWATPTAI